MFMQLGNRWGSGFTRLGCRASGFRGLGVGGFGGLGAWGSGFIGFLGLRVLGTMWG